MERRTGWEATAPVPITVQNWELVWRPMLSASPADDQIYGGCSGASSCVRYNKEKWEKLRSHSRPNRTFPHTVDKHQQKFQQQI